MQSIFSNVNLPRMPRQSRIDAPRALNQIITRGIERKRIFYDDQDRRELGISMAEMARRLDISSPAVSQSVQRGEKIASENGYGLIR